MRVPAAETLLSGTPITGTVASIRAVGAFITDVGEDAGGFHDEVSRASVALGELTGSGVSALRGKASELSSGAVLLAECAAEGKIACDAYARDVHDIHVDARDVKREVELQLQTIAAQHAVLDQIATTIGATVSENWDAPPPGQMPEPDPETPVGAKMSPTEVAQLRADLETLYSQSWSVSATAWSACLDSIETQRTQWSGLITDRRAAEQSFVSALGETALGQMIAIAEMTGTGRKFAVAAGFAGELWGHRADSPWAEPLHRVLDDGTSPEDVAQAWRELIAAGGDTDELVRRYSIELAGIDGLPYSVMDRAGRYALRFALDPDHPEHLGEAYRRLGFQPGERSPEAFATDLVQLRRALSRAERGVDEGETVQLISFGRHDGAVTAGISLGDLDTASTVGVLVSGMRSSVRNIGDSFDAFAMIRDGDEDMAMVTWMGYHSPSLPSEPFQSQADAGGAAFSRFLDGLAAQRGGDPISRLAVIGHSYGTNVIAEALQATRARVDAYVSLGSAGLKRGTTADALGVDEIHATHANRDNIAQNLGRRIHFDGATLAYPQLTPYLPRTDPRALEGAHVFSSEQTEEGKQVTMHNLKTPIDWGLLQGAADRLDGTRAADEVGYLDQESSTVLALKTIMDDSWEGR